jgi:hypothetical protein
VEESNMPAPESTKFQVNYSLPNGTLVNIYATTVSELEAGLADLAMNALNIRATGAELSGGAVAPAPAAAPTVAAVAAAFNATPVAAAPAGGDQVCRHGVMAFRSGTSARGPWKGYMCAAPKGCTNREKCDTIWIR